MAKRMQEQEREERIVAKSKPTTMNLAVSVSTSSSAVNAPESPGILKASCRTDWSSSGKLDARNSNHDAASNSQGWQKDADKILPHSLHISRNNVPHMEKVFSILRQKCGLGPMDLMKHLDVNTAIWSILLSVTLQAAVYLGVDYAENLRPTKNQH